MRDKIDLALKIKERVISRNISLNSLKGLPSHIYNNLQVYLKKAIIIYRGTVINAKIEHLSEKTLLIYELNNIQLTPQEIIIVVIPSEFARYIFICKVISMKDNSYEVLILDPRTDERIEMKAKTPAFLSLIPKEFVKEILNNNEYFLFRESNITSDNYNTLNEFHIYDLILDSNHTICEKFKKYIQKTLFLGELKDISRGGCGIKCQGRINFEDEFGLFYVKFNIQSKKHIKFALFSHLRNISYYDEFSIFHLAFLTEIKPGIWQLIREDLLSAS